MPFAPSASEKRSAHRAGASMGAFKRDLQAEINFTNQGGSYSVMRCSLPVSTTNFTLVDGTAYWVYLGRAQQQITYNFINLWIATAGTGTVTVAVGTTDAPPVRNTGTVITVRAVQGFTSVINTASRNATALGFTPTVTEHVWVGIMQAGGTLQAGPSLFKDYSLGFCQQVAAAPAFVVGQTQTGAIIAPSLGNPQAPELFFTTT